MYIGDDFGACPRPQVSRKVRRFNLKERIVFRRAAIVIQPENKSRQVVIVRFRTAKLIIIAVGSEAGVMFCISAAPVVAHVDVELAIRAKKNFPPLWLPRGVWFRVFLKGVQLNDIFVETQRRAIPDEAVYALPRSGTLSESATRAGLVSAEEVKPSHWPRR